LPKPKEKIKFIAAKQIFEFKERFYKPGLLDDLAKKATTMVKSTKGIVGKTATKLYKKLKRFFPEY
jgi:hypothetical protein